MKLLSVLKSKINIPRQRLESPALPSLLDDRQNKTTGLQNSWSISTLLRGVKRRSNLIQDRTKLWAKSLRSRITKLLPTRSFRHVASIGVCALLIATIAMPVLSIIQPSQVQAGWWNEDYGFRQVIDVESGSDQANVYLDISLDTSNTDRFQNDCQDIRFVSQSGELLPHYIVSGCGTSDTDIQILVSNLIEGDSVIYVYYDNPQALPMAAAEAFNNAATSVTVTPGSEERSTGPLGYWKFNESYGSTINSSTSTNHSGALSNTEWRAGDNCVAGSCLLFNGTNSSVDVTDNGTFNVNDSFTLSSWIKLEALPADPYNSTSGNFNIFSRQSWSDKLGYRLAVVGAGGNRLYFEIGNGADRQNYQIYPSMTESTIHKWQHVVATFDSGQVRLYLDGQLKVSAISDIASVAEATGQSLRIGRHSAGGEYFNGFIDEPKIYDYARSMQQVQQEYVAGMQSLNRQESNLSNGLVGHWKMNEASWNGTAGEVKDASGSGSHGTALGASLQAGKYGNGGVFDGVDDYVRLPNPSIGDTHNVLTFSTWFKPGAQSGAILGPHSNGFDNYIIYDSINKKINVRVAEAEDTNERTRSSTDNSVIDTTWNHLVVSIQDKTIKIYLNGKLDSTFTETIAIANWSTSGYWDLGQRGNDTSRFLGSIDDVRVYNRALSSKEVEQLNAFGGAPRVDIDFNEESGATAFDKSGNGFDVTITASRTEGISGGGLLADGDEGGRINDNLYFDEQSFTIMSWVKTSNDTEGQQRIFGSAFNGVDNSFLWVNLDYGVPVLEYWFDSPIWIESDGGSIADNRWHHVAVVVDRVLDKQQVVVDGVVQAEHAGEIVGKFGDATNAESFRLGYHSGSLPEFSLDGTLDNFRVYDYAMSPYQIAQAMQGDGIQTLKPTSHWKLNEKTGTSAADSGLLGVDGNITGCDWTTAGPGGASIECDGSGYVEIEPNVAYASPDFSMSFWLKLGVLNEGGPFENMILDFDDYLVAGFRMGIDEATGGTLDFWTTQNAGDIQIWGSKPLQDDAWHHIAVTYNSKQQMATTFIDGRYEGSNAGVYIPPTNEYLYINGSGGGTGRSNSTFSDVKFYNFALSPQQIAVNYNQSAAVVVGASSTDPVTKLPSNAIGSRYCVPGDSSTCREPVAEWNFEEGSGDTVKDISGNGHNGTWSGSVDRYDIGKIGQAGSFDGATSGVQITAGNNSELDGESGFSYGLWLKRPSDSSNEWPVILGQSETHEGYGLRSSEYGARLMFEYGLPPYDGSTQDRLQCDNGHFPSNEWHYFTVTYDGAKASLYQNGILCESKSIVLNPTFQSNIYMMSGTGFYKGLLDEVRIYDYARTQAQIAWDYNYGKPVIHYKFNECQGGTVHDSAHLKFHAILNLGSSGNTSIGSCNQPSSAWGLGKAGKDAGAMYFDGIDDYAVADYDANPELRENFSLAAWIKPASTGTNMAIIGYDFGPELTFFVGADGSLTIYPYDGYSANWPNYSANTAAGLVVAGEWQHVAATISGTEIKLYYNGRLVNEHTIASTYPSGYESPLMTIGQTGAGWMNYWFEGLMDDVQVYNYALSAEQLKVVYNGGTMRWGP